MSEGKLVIEDDYYNGSELIDDDDNVRVKYCIDKFINKLKVHNVNCNCNKEVDRVNNLNRLFTANKIKIHPRCKKLINDYQESTYRG